MKKVLYFMLIVGFFAIAYSAKFVETRFENTTGKTKSIVGQDCIAAYERKCNFNRPMLFPSPAITNIIDVDNFCRQTSISCPINECVARLGVLYGFWPGSPKTDSCLPAGFRGK